MNDNDLEESDVFRKDEQRWKMSQMETPVPTSIQKQNFNENVKMMPSFLLTTGLTTIGTFAKMYCDIYYLSKNTRSQDLSRFTPFN